MTAPLLGPFRLTARSSSSPAGVVFAAVDPAGRPHQVVVLTKGAASDPAARDRFAAAVRTFPGTISASDVTGDAPWVAGGEGVENLLKPVLLTGTGRGPQFLHHWTGMDEPAFPPPSKDAPLLVPKSELPRGTFLGLLVLAVFFLLVGLALYFLVSCQPTRDAPAEQQTRPAVPAPNVPQPTTTGPPQRPTPGQSGPTVPAPELDDGESVPDDGEPPV